MVRTVADETERRWVDSMPAAYEQLLVPTVFQPFAVDLARRVAADDPEAVLELAAGTGALTAALVAAGVGSLVATDLNAAMVELGRVGVPDADWHQADAADLPFGLSTFDAVACQFGVMFFPDKPAAFAQVRRVLAEDGVFRFNTWAPVETHDFAAALTAGLERAFPDDPPTFVAAVPHGYTDPDLIEGDLAAGGLLVDEMATVTVAGHAASARDVAVGFCLGTPVRAAIEQRDDLDQAIEVVAEAMEERLGTGPVIGHMTAYVVAASPAD